jgi:hypothetical protein
MRSAAPPNGPVAAGKYTRVSVAVITGVVPAVYPSLFDLPHRLSDKPDALLPSRVRPHRQAGARGMVGLALYFMLHPDIVTLLTPTRTLPNGEKKVRSIFFIRIFFRQGYIGISRSLRFCRLPFGPRL